MVLENKDDRVIIVEDGIVTIASVEKKVTFEELVELLSGEAEPKNTNLVKEETTKEEVEEEEETTQEEEEEEEDLTEEEVGDMDRDELEETIEEYELDIDPSDFKKTKKLRAKVLEELFEE